MNSCITCGMPFTGEHKNDIGLETSEGLVCINDSEDGDIKEPEDIFADGVAFFADNATDGDFDLAERLTRKNMLKLPYWQHNLCEELEGPIATDDEFEEAMARLS
jgi:hypothetical protein|tara:strand:- start:249921 stop:250235 length:315 start_codon:yes stop_codon:yes gene_type:complete